MLIPLTVFPPSRQRFQEIEARAEAQLRDRKFRLILATAREDRFHREKHGASLRGRRCAKNMDHRIDAKSVYHSRPIRFRASGPPVAIGSSRSQAEMTKTYDVCVVGGGIVGLWTTRCLLAAGVRAILIERDHCGAGASGGVLGALMAHAPDNWNAKKQFQFNALAQLPERIADLEAETGLKTGYSRCGRIMPIRREKFRTQAEHRSEAAAQHWRSDGQAFQFDVQPPPTAAGWMDVNAAPLGFVHDTLAARVDPARYVAALKQFIASQGALREKTSFASFDAAARRVNLSGGAEPLNADQIVLTAGYATFDLLAQLTGHQIGGGVKGQAAVFHCPDAVGQPLIYDDGVYIVPHDDGTCAVGSTSEKNWDDPTTPDPNRSDFIDRAVELCPSLRGAPLLRRWAGVRPRCLRTDPVIGRIQPGSPILVATGGYKITFGIAHVMAKCIADEVIGAEQREALPASFQPPHHITE